MGISIEKISKGGAFCVEFNSIKVERCHYINASEERVENTTMLSNAKAVMIRVQNEGTIFVKLMIQERERIFAQFKTTYSSYQRYEDYNVEMARTDVVIEEYPVDIEGLENGRISQFIISKQKGCIISFFIINPKSHDDYYYRVMFSEYMSSIYQKSFVFEAKRYEEYRDGRCVSQGAVECTIKAHKMSFSPYDPISTIKYNALESKVGWLDIDGGMTFSLSGNLPIGINAKFDLPIIEEDDVLPDRVQYGRLTDRAWKDNKEPVVCNIFNNMKCIRFAMTSPLRIIEFFGEFTEIR